MKTLASLFCAMALATSAAADTVTIKGSDTMVILGQRWAEQYMKAHPSTQIQVTGGGSGTGISALINGTTDICQSSRAMKPAEKEKLRERYATPGVEIPVARDGVAVYVNSANPIQGLTVADLKAIFTGKVQNWKELGGADEKIIVYSRENSSGTYVFFKEMVLGGADFTPRAQSLPGTAAVVNAVAREKKGIGYGGAAYAKNIRIVPVKKDASAASVVPTPETVRSGSYPLARPLYFYLRNKPSGSIASLIDWIKGAQGQAIVSQVGYFPL